MSSVRVRHFEDGCVQVTFVPATTQREPAALADEAVTQAVRIIRRRFSVRAIIARAVVGALFVGSVLVVAASAHDVTSAVVDCTRQTVTITGTGFAIPANSPVTVSRQGGGYSTTFAITTSDWTQVVGPIAPSSLIPNGVYTVDWPGSDGHAVTFQVFCQRSLPTPTPVVTPTPTPTPVVTPSPSPSPTSTPVVTPRPTPAPTPVPTPEPTPVVTLPPTDT